MSEEFVDKKQFANIVKKIKGSVFAINIDNMLFGMRKPKMLITLVQPAPEMANEKYLRARFYIGVPEIVKISDAIMRIRPNSEQAVSLFQGYQGSMDKKKGCIEARVLRITTKLSHGTPYYTFSIENCAGVQTTVKNGAGQMVPGVVKPATGANAKTFAKNSFGATRDEAVYLATMMRMELQAWRTAVNTEMLFYPDRYNYRAQGNRAPANQMPPTVADWED